MYRKLMRPPVEAILVSTVILILLLTLTPAPALAQAIPQPCPAGTPANVICNGSGAGASELGPTLKGAFLFEPEFPLDSLKTLPIWNELEQLLDNPYRVALCSSLGVGVQADGTTVSAFDRTTTGTTFIGQGTGTTSPPPVVYPAYCSSGVVRRRGFGVALPPLMLHPLNYNPTDGEEFRLLNPGYPGTPWIVPDHLVQCSTTEALTNPVTLIGCNGTRSAPGPGGVLVTTGPFDANRWVWTYKNVTITGGSGRVLDAEIDYNAPVLADPGLFPLNPSNFICEITTEVVPAEGSMLCGGDPGEPNYFGFGVNNSTGYSTPAVPGGMLSTDPLTGMMFASDITGKPLFDPTRGFIVPRTGANGGLRKPSLRVAAAGGRPNHPNYLWNSAASLASRGTTAADPTGAANLAPSNENDYVRDRTIAAVLGKSLFWEQQVGSDTVQACGSCHAHAGADNRTKNQMNPNDIGGDLMFEVGQLQPTLLGANHDLVASDFPIHKLSNPEIAGDPACSPAITATIPALSALGLPVLENNFPNGGTVTVCDKANIANQRPDGTDQNDVASSMGVHFGVFLDIPTPNSTPGGTALNVLTNGVASLKPDLRSPCIAVGTPPGCLANDRDDPIPGFAGVDGTGHQFRRVEPRNTPTVFAAAINFDNFWDGRARHDFNGGSVFGAADPQSHVFVVADDAGTIVPTRQLIRFVSIASLATGPALSKFEMSFVGRNWAKLGKKLLQRGVTPLASQLVDPTDGVLGPYSNQNGSACAALTQGQRSPLGGPPTVLGAGVPGLCINYRSLIRQAFYPDLWSNSYGEDGATQHLNGCYTDARPDIHPNQCVGLGPIPILDNNFTATPTLNTTNTADPFDGYRLTIANGAVNLTDTNQFSHMEGNMSLFFGVSVAVWGTLLIPDNTPLDQFLDANRDMFESIGEVGEPGLVGPMPVCTDPLGPGTQRHCFREVGNFKRDSSFADTRINTCQFPHAGEGVITQTLVTVSPCLGTRDPNSNAPDPLLGMDIFQGSNYSLKNPNFRAARCEECHAGATLTDNTMSFTQKAQLGDFIGEFITAGNEALVEPLGRTRIITGFLLENELNDNGADAIERRIINQSIVPCPDPARVTAVGLAFPDGIAGPNGLETVQGLGHGTCEGAGSAFFDNGVYNLGVTICQADQAGVTGRCDDNGRGNTDAFGWPMSLAALMLKNLGGPGQQPGTPLPTFNPTQANPTLSNTGGLFDITAQDQTLNPGVVPEPATPMLPPYQAPFASAIVHGDSMPDIDEVFSGLNTLTDVAITEGFIDVTGPFNPAGILNESNNNGEGPLMGNWPFVNRVGRFGSIKAPQLREVELTGPYFHNGGKLTLRQVVDFYVRGGDYPITNATHRDFNIINLTIEKQSNLKEEEKVALVDFLLELTDSRVTFEQAPFDHPELILPLDGTAPENTGGRSGTFGVTGTGSVCTDASQFGPGQRACSASGMPTGMFLDVPATGGTVGNGGHPLPNFLNIVGAGGATDPLNRPRQRLVGAAANCGAVATSQYCH